MVAKDDDDDPAAERGRLVQAAAQGRAALLLIEGLLHALVEGGRLSRGEAVSAAEGALEIAQELSKGIGSAPDAVDETANILSRLVDSLHRDLQD